MEEHKKEVQKAWLWLWIVLSLVVFSIICFSGDTPKVAYEPPVDGAILQSYYDKGHAEGLEKGTKQGYNKGYKEGVARGFEEGDFNACLTILTTNQKQLVESLDNQQACVAWASHICDRYPNVRGCQEPPGEKP